MTDTVSLVYLVVKKAAVNKFAGKMSEERETRIPVYYTICSIPEWF